MKSRWNLSAVGIVTAAVILLGVVLPTPPGWQLYRALGPSAAAAGAYEHPDSCYRFRLPEGWVYQSRESDSQLAVFYGCESHNLLYVERFVGLPDEDSAGFADRVVTAYTGAAGLQAMDLEVEPTPTEVAGLPAAKVVYSYQPDGRERLWEQRIFVVDPKAGGWTITIADHEAGFTQTQATFQQILASWRWSAHAPDPNQPDDAD